MDEKKTQPDGTRGAAAATGRSGGSLLRTIVKVLVGAVVVLGLIVGGFCIVVAMQPSTYHIERSAAMAAPPEVVFAQVNDFHNWQAWSPWSKLDPNAKEIFEGPAAGEGAVFRWSGNAEVGEGSMTITESVPHERIKIRLDFVKPMEDTAAVEFTFKPQGEQTEVTWSMDGQNGFIGRAFCLLMNMDMEAMVGDSYAEGLKNIESIVEAPPE
jgi:hypothetical protein